MDQRRIPNGSSSRSKALNDGDNDDDDDDDGQNADDDNEDDDYEEVQEDSDDDNNNRTVSEGEIISKFQMSYSGHRNVRTVKEVVFLGPRSEYVATGSDDGNVFIWNTSTGKIINILEDADSYVVNCVAPHPTNFPVLATSGIDNDIKLWMPTAEIENDLRNANEIMESNRRRGTLNFVNANTSMIFDLLFALDRSNSNNNNNNNNNNNSNNNNSSGSEGDDSDSRRRRRRRAGDRCRIN